MQIKTILGVVALTSLALVSTGCAFGTRHANITYPPDPDHQDAAANAKPAGSSGRVALQSFVDDRADKRLVGHVRNGFGMKTADVVSDQQDLSALVTGAVRAELQKAGYEVVGAEGKTEEGVPVLAGSLTRLYCDAYMNYEGEATLILRVQRDGEEVYRKTYEGKGSAGMNWTATGASYGKSVSFAIVDAIEVMLRDLPTALNQ